MNEFAAGFRRLVILQITIGGFVAAGFFLKSGQWAAQSAISGCMISIVLTGLLYWGVSRAAKSAPENKKKGMALLYIGAAQRFLLALVLFGLAVGKVGLEPMPLVAGFVLSQAAFMIFSRRSQSATTSTVM